MFAAFLLLVPAPPAAPPPERPLSPAGEWRMAWGTVSQGNTTFRGDGSYSSPCWGDGRWSLESGWVLFTEGGRPYLLRIVEADDYGLTGFGCPAWAPMQRVEVQLRPKALPLGID